MKKHREKTWEQKVSLVNESYSRSKKQEEFASVFYQNLFFLNPKTQKYFEHTDFAHQDKALMKGLDFMLSFLNTNDEHARKQVLRIAVSHSQKGLNIHPHHYYYWIEAVILTLKKNDPGWYPDLEYYWREVIFFPVSFIMSQYFSQEIEER